MDWGLYRIQYRRRDAKACAAGETVCPGGGCVGPTNAQGPLVVFPDSELDRLRAIADTINAGHDERDTIASVCADGAARFFYVVQPETKTPAASILASIARLWLVTWTRTAAGTALTCPSGAQIAVTIDRTPIAYGLEAVLRVLADGFNAGRVRGVPAAQYLCDGPDGTNLHYFEVAP